MKMEDLGIRRNRSFAPSLRQSVSRTEKQTGAAAAQKTARGTGLAVSETLRQLMTRSGQAAEQTRESRRTLQMGESVLAEVQEKLGRMAELAEEAENGGAGEALQAEWDQLAAEVDRMLTGASADPMALFLDETEEAPAEESKASAGWLLKAVATGKIDTDQLLKELGLDKNASGADVLAALADRLPERDPAAAQIASLYLGALIAGGSNAGGLSVSAALDGLRQLLEKTADGMPVDKAIELLTGGQYASLEDFQQQFGDGTLPGLQQFLTNLFLTGGEDFALPGEISLLTYMTGAGGMDLDLMMLLMNLGMSSDVSWAEQAEAVSPDTAAATASAAGTALPDESAQPMTVLRFGDIQVMGRDLSAVAYDEASSQLTIGGTADVVLQGLGRAEQTIRLTGSGMVTVQNLRAAVLTADTAEVRIVTSGENAIGEVRLGGNTTLTVDGRGLLRTDAFRGGEHSLLRLTGGAVEVTAKEDGTPGELTIPVLLEGPVSLSARAASVRTPEGEPLEPMDILWQTLLPGFSAVTAMELAGRQARMSLMNGEHPDALRLWLAKGDLSNHGYPAHTLTIRGRDESGQTRTRYAYLRWDQGGRRFQEFSMYPNPFNVTGGEEDKDWTYEEETHTLHILTDRVKAISGGMGASADQEPFSGRIALQDRIGQLQLALGGVVCRVSAGQAFRLGRENEVTLLLRGGTANIFESGEGYAGISLGDGTSLRVDCLPPKANEAAGTLTATGGPGSVGIGRDSGPSRGRTGHIMIRSGTVTAGEKAGDAGSVTIVGSTAGGTSDLGGSRTWARMGVCLQMGEDALILPQIHLSSRTLQLNKLRVSTREYAHAARMTIDADRHWVSQIQTAYNDLSNRLERSAGGPDGSSGSFNRTESLIRDNTSASVLLREMSQKVPTLTYRAQQIRSQQAFGDVSHFFR